MEQEHEQKLKAARKHSPWCHSQHIYSMYEPCTAQSFGGNGAQHNIRNNKSPPRERTSRDERRATGLYLPNSVVVWELRGTCQGRVPTCNGRVRHIPYISGTITGKDAEQNNYKTHGSRGCTRQSPLREMELTAPR